MGNRRLAHFPSSDDDGDGPPPPADATDDEGSLPRKRKKKLRLYDEDEEEKDQDEEKLNERSDRKRKKKSEEPEDETDGDTDEVDELEALPLGDVVKVSGKGKGRRTHYSSFEYDGLQYQLEDSVLLVPEGNNQKPYVAIIKDIAQTHAGAVMVTGQWFYRPEEAEKKGGGNWQSSDTRELFYSFHRDEVPAESVMHKCIVHFIPVHKQIPSRQQHPGFIVQKVYDTEQRRLFKLTDKDYEDNKQHEIDLLVQKTLGRVGDIPDLDIEEPVLDDEDPVKNKRLIRRRNLQPLEISREDGGSFKFPSNKAENPGSACVTSSERFAIPSNFKISTGETQRDKWIEIILKSIQPACCPEGSRENCGDEKTSLEHGNEFPDKGDASLQWPDAAVPVVAALEKAAHDALSSDFQKYNQKMRALNFNLKKYPVLARRLVTGELEPAQLLNMKPEDMREGSTAEKRKGSKEPEEPLIQMTDARCNRCNEKRVGLKDIIHAGHGDRYQLECTGCGNTWFASRDEASALTLEAPSAKTPAASSSKDAVTESCI